MDDNARSVPNNGHRLLHAYVIAGGAESSREEYALRLAQEAVCSSDGARPCRRCAHCAKVEKGLHPDVIFVEKRSDKSELTIDVLRSVRADTYVLPNEAARKVYIIRGADMMNMESQNAMLKVFEEPPEFVVFILVAENPQKLLPTVLSRCALLSVPPVEEEPVSEKALQFVALAEERDSAALLRFILTLDKMEKAEFSFFLAQAKRAAVQKLRAGGAAERLLILISAVEEAEKCLAVNVGRVHLTGMLLARLV